MKITYRGVEYKSYIELTEKFNVNYRTFSRRLSKGYTLEESLLSKEEFNHVVHSDLAFEYRGKTFNKISDFMEYYKVGRKRAQYILDNNINIDDLGDKHNGWKSIGITINGKKYSSWKEIVLDYPDRQLSESLVSLRYFKGKRDYELIEPKRHIRNYTPSNNIEIDIENKHFISLREVSEFYDFPYETLKLRYRKGIRGSDLVRPYTNKANKLKKFQNKG